MTTIGLLGGSFNPIHTGHMIVASYVAQFGPVDEVWFVLSPRNPLKDPALLAPDADRLEMLRIAVESNTRLPLKVSDIELSLPRPSYTIDTLRTLSDMYPEHRFVWITGSDTLPQLHRWKNWEEITGDYGMIVYPRPGFPVKEPTPEGVRIVDAPQVEISSTFIREAIASGKNMTYFLPQGVENFILARGIYKSKR